jgi:hypothetical protein
LNSSAETISSASIFFGLGLSDALTISLTFAGVLLAIVIPLTQYRIAQRQLTISLHETYWSVETYVRVIAPSYAVQKGWQGLPEQVRVNYREIVLQGWAPHLPSPEDEYELYLGAPPEIQDFAAHHFRTPVGNDKLTEHQALTLLLYWWSHLAEYYRNRLVNRRLFRALFRDAFGYKKAFLLDLCSSMESRLTGTDTRPQWIDSIRYLTDVLEPKKN